MAAAAGIFNHLAASRAQMASPMDTSTSGTSSSDDSSSDSSTISANDFLTLLVTEMQNQDPTADTDPNEYINQLVQVNSLEQLIDINQNLSTALGDSTTGSSSTDAAGANSSQAGKTTAAAVNATSGLLHARTSGSTGPSLPAGGSVALGSSTKFAPGNLSVPSANPAAQRVGHALDGRSSMDGKPRGQPIAASLNAQQ